MWMRMLSTETSMRFFIRDHITTSALRRHPISVPDFVGLAVADFAAPSRLRALRTRSRPARPTRQRPLRERRLPPRQAGMGWSGFRPDRSVGRGSVRLGAGPNVE